MFGLGGCTAPSKGAAGGKSWIFRYKVAGRERVMGLGPFPDVLLAEARIKAAECRRLRIENVDALEIKSQEYRAFRYSLILSRQSRARRIGRTVERLQR